MEYKDYYRILGVEKTAGQDEIKRAYRKLARKYHPDVNQEVEAEARFKELGEAYEVLKDPEKRTAYDQLGSQWKQGQSGFRPPPDWDAGFEFHGGGFTGGQDRGFSDFFESLFGQRPGYGSSGFSSSGFHQQSHARGQDSHARVFIDLEDAYNGATRGLTLQTTIMSEEGRPHIKPRTLNVKIPKGVKAGQNIRLQGQGSPGVGSGAAGDLYLEIAFNPHSLFKVDGADVSLEVPITPWEAALGSTVKVPIPGNWVDLKIPAGTSGGKRMRLKGKGIPAATPGDFYVELNIAMPENLDEHSRALFEQLQQSNNGFDPRAHFKHQRSAA